MEISGGRGPWEPGSVLQIFRHFFLQDYCFDGHGHSLNSKKEEELYLSLQTKETEESRII